MKKFFTAAVFLFFCAGAVCAAVMDELITVRGEATVNVNPDRAVLEVSVNTRGNDLLDAQSRNGEAVRRVIDYCIKNGIDENSIRTDFISVHPVYKNFFEDKNPVFTVERSLSITIENISKYDAVITDLLGLGVNQIRNVSFQVRDINKHRSEARRLAVAAARQKAEELAAETGVKLGRAAAVTEDGGRAIVPLARNANMITMANDFSSGAQTQSSGIGTIAVNSSVVISYRIK